MGGRVRGKRLSAYGGPTRTASRRPGVGSVSVAEMARTRAMADAVHEEHVAAERAAALAEMTRPAEIAGGSKNAGRGLAFPPCPKCQGISYFV